MRGLDIVERGNFDEKCRYCFEVYDIFAIQELDLISLRTLFKRTYSVPLIKLDEVLLRIEQWPKQNSLEGWSWSDFEATLLPVL